MKLLRPRTFLNLVVFGFVAVSLPLGVGLWTTLNSIDQVTGAGLNVVDYAVNGTRDSEILKEYLRDEERMLRLYSVAARKEYVKQAERYHKKIDTILYELLDLPLNRQVRDDLEEMRHFRNGLREIIIVAKNSREPMGDKIDMKEVSDSFSFQHEQAEKIRIGIDKMMQREITGLQTTTARTQKALVAQTGAFILATIVMIVVMAYILSWPIRQLNKSVERLGKGDFKTPVLVNGPRDIEAVGEKLDWLRKRLDTLEQEKTKFMAHISHELKTPLASIREGAALLNEGLVGDLNDKQQDVVSILVNNSVLLQRLIENIISFNMAQAGQQAPAFERIDLKELVEKAVYDQRTKMIGRAIKGDIKLARTEVYGDRKKLETIFENLFSNAVTFCPNGGTIGCRLNSDKEKAVCIIFDSGAGVAKEEAEKIFQPFYQAETGAYSTIKGSGLGLAIVREYVRHHNGYISLLNPGEPGARFGVTLPVHMPSKTVVDVHAA